METKKLRPIILKNKTKIIKMNQEGGLDLKDIAEKIGAHSSTICRYFKEWGISVIRHRIYLNKKRNNIRKPQEKKHWYRKFSKEFLEHRAKITKSNKNRVKYMKGVNLSGYKRLIRNLL